MALNLDSHWTDEQVIGGVTEPLCHVLGPVKPVWPEHSVVVELFLPIKHDHLQTQLTVLTTSPGREKITFN